VVNQDLKSKEIERGIFH